MSTRADGASRREPDDECVFTVEPVPDAGTRAMIAAATGSGLNVREVRPQVDDEPPEMLIRLRDALNETARAGARFVSDDPYCTLGTVFLGDWRIDEDLRPGHEGEGWKIRRDPA